MQRDQRFRYGGGRGGSGAAEERTHLCLQLGGYRR